MLSDLSPGVRPFGNAGLSRLSPASGWLLTVAGSPVAFLVAFEVRIAAWSSKVSGVKNFR
jgi:hypothetical protein